MRKLPQGLPAINELAAQPQEPRITQRREYRIITALFGGGVEPSKADPITVVRATEVRGHLRFWWRATRGGQYGSLEDLKAAEDAIWGAAATPDGKIGQSAVWVEVVQWSEGKTDTPYEVFSRDGVLKSQHRRGSVSPAYIDFPLQPPEAELKKGNPQMPLEKTRFNVTFTITLSYLNKWETDVEAALWAWETFGGIGGRTRRGFGALRCLSKKVNGEQKEIDLPTSEDAFSWIKDRLEHYKVQSRTLTTKQVPLLPTSEALSPELNCWVGSPSAEQLSKEQINSHHLEADSVRVWISLIERYATFRQQRPIREVPDENNPAKKRRIPGRNRWPEPDAIRRLTTRRSRRHGNDVSDVDKFPRAAFGLPMQFKFKDSDDPDGKNPLLPKQDKEVLERFASPLILKPLACSDGVIGLALILANTAVPTTLSIETSKGKRDVFSDLTSDEASSIKRVDNNPLLGTETDVLKAFLRFLQA